ncbi:hypothetical protein V5E97_18880 [Singulisphaera sp. Ch08]|uniref:RiboL-PSP-HEPN domain-containing protein n=1 Tax=Singulisphaera sp. Ch08 TaxID=3120278 RepID=A0AAU7CSL3_9BACT
MARSTRYRELRKAITKSRHALLPSKFDPTGTYRNPDKVHYRALSFRIMVHAEIEAYLEDRSREVLDAAWKHWKATRVPSETIICLLGYSEVALKLPPDSLGGGPNKLSYESIETPLQKAYNVWLRRSRENHGIKEANVLSLVLPLGIEHTKLGTTLLNDLSSYGLARGLVAHTSNYTITQYADPKDEFNTATNLATSLEKLDELFNCMITRLDRFAKA